MLCVYPNYLLTCIFGATAARQDYIACRDAATVAAIIGLNDLGNEV
jgi:hypothetical protein